LDADSPADRLVMQAHQLSINATREDDFTKIIENCRKARGGQASLSVAKFADQLASWAFNRRGQMKAAAGQIDEALLDFNDAVRADPTRWRALHNRGVLYSQQGDFEKAFDDFNRTVEINPEFAKAYSNRGALFVVVNDLNKALDDYKRAIDVDPTLAVAHRGCGRVCHLLGRLDEAIQHYDSAMRLAPNDAFALASRADLLTDMGRYAEAAAGYDLAIKIDSKSAHAYGGSAWLLATCPDANVRDPERAIERARMAIELSESSDAVSLDTLAAAQANAGNFSDARRSIQKAIQCAPPDERDVYEDRLAMYQRSMPFRISPVESVTQASFERK
jgi:tetratricopeptide (TPR) repeat protein